MHDPVDNADEMVDISTELWNRLLREVPDVGNPSEILQQLHTKFVQTYRGSGTQCLLSALEDYKKQYAAEIYDGKVISFNQSSGTGMTRTMEQLGYEITFVGICMRGIKERMYNRNSGLDVKNGWPRGDEPVFTFFALGTEYKGEELACAFLAGLFETITVVAERSSTRDQFRKEWEVSGQPSTRTSRRYRNFQAAVQCAESLLLQHGPDLIEMRAIVEDDAQFTIWIHKLYHLLVEPKAATIPRVVAKFNSTIVIGIDECEELDVPESRTSRYASKDERAHNGSSLVALRRAMKLCESLDVWFILADRKIKEPDLDLPLDVLGPAARLRHASPPLASLAPYYRVEWDTQALPEHKPNTPHQALMLGHLKRYGRPCWATIADCEVLDTARIKLLGTKEPFDPENVQHVLSIFSSRLLLHLSEQSCQMAIESVRHHMRIFTGFSSKAVVTTQAPSEPILSAAAMACLLPDQETYKKATKTLVRELIMKDHVVERSVQGELRVQTLLMLARDEAEMTASEPWTLDTWADGLQPINLANLLRALLGDELGTSDAQRTLATEILDCSDGYFVNYTHFVQVTEDLDELSSDFLHECWSRGVAIVCTHKQPNCDIVIVAYGGDLSQPFDASKWAIVSVQVKMKTQPTVGTIPTGLTCPTVIDPKSGTKKPGYLAILMNMGTAMENKDIPAGTRCTLHPTQPRLEDSAIQSEPYVVDARGCGSDIHAVITKLAPDLLGLDWKQQELFPTSTMATFSPLTQKTVHKRGEA